jgi:hypothetical protein
MPTAAPPPAPPALVSPAPVAYALDLSWDEQTRTLSGSEQLTLQNLGARPVRRIWLRVWPNAWRPSQPHRAHGCAAPLARVEVVSGGQANAQRRDCSALAIRLAEPLAPGGTTSIGLQFADRVTRTNDRFGVSGGITLLGNAIPVLAVHDGAGWHLDPYSATGDPGFSSAAAWSLRLRLPASLQAATTGVEQRNVVDGDVREIVASTPQARDFALAIGPMHALTATVDGVDLRVFALDGSSPTTQHQALTNAAQALATFDGWYGQYPSTELDIVLADLPYWGMEYPEIIYTTPDAGTVAHEIAHQWWYGIVGDDQFASPWLDESFAAWNEQQFAPGTYRCDPADPLHGSNVPLTTGMGWFDHHQAAYWRVVYADGQCALARLAQDIGRTRFLQLLRGYAAAHWFGITTTADFLDAVRAAAPPGYDVDAWARLVRLE